MEQQPTISDKKKVEGGEGDEHGLLKVLRMYCWNEFKAESFHHSMDSSREHLLDYGFEAKGICWRMDSRQGVDAMDELVELKLMDGVTFGWIWVFVCAYYDLGGVGLGEFGFVSGELWS
ncbi:hypothetical protein Acr_13g0005780 [Actinidia rufa]|uniref:Uncharacterized protein n=1 Tax=Actinidia rufa TaxID=165716 RepID=A0A7J0FML1_9ERIC|nr:hypothetical protein Acr_13g0005780 [Actinidia rufa]